VSACINTSERFRSYFRFKDAVASIRRTTTEYNYQLAIQRAYEEGEEQLLESDDGDLDDGTISFTTILPTFGTIAFCIPVVVRNIN
jgi:VID27 N-terminal region